MELIELRDASPRPKVIEDQRTDLRIVKPRDPDGSVIQVTAPLEAGPDKGVPNDRRSS